jgi:hypothetical protein
MILGRLLVGAFPVIAKLPAVQKPADKYHSAKEDDLLNKELADAKSNP